MSAVLMGAARINLLQTAHKLQRYSLLAVDGEIGGVENLYFDDTTWAVRYLAVSVGGWPAGKHVLISPVAIGEVDEEQGTINIELTRNQIVNSPPISADRPITRQYEKGYYQYYDWTPYWKSGPFASRSTSEAPIASSLIPDAEDTHLNSTAEVNGYAIAALDGEIGRVDGIVIDAQYWVIRYLEIDTHRWWPGKHVLINPAWVKNVNWAERVVSVDLTCDAIRRAPGFNPSKVIGRDYEVQLFKYYGRNGYWAAR